MPTHAKRGQKAVHRNLHTISPAMTGPDVEALQTAVNKELRHRKLEWRCVKVDGQFGPRTMRAATFLGWVLGFGGRRLGAMSPDRSYQPHLSEAVQRTLRDPSSRSPFERARERARKGKVQSIRHTHRTGPTAAIAFIRNMAARGVHEVGESNTGKWVDKFTGFFNLHAVAWCGCLAGYAAVVMGNCKAKALSFWSGYALITEGAAGKDGCYEVGFDEIEGGEILVLWNGEHVVTAADKPVGDTVETGEGNTSPNNGDSQADGGAVAMKTRTRSDVTCAIRIYG